MPTELSSIEARVMGCLLEKSVTTPDQYPLTLNALTNACNQKSSRHPVMSLEPGEVQRTIRALQDKHLVRCEENFKTRVEKYTQRLCNTPFSDYQFDQPEFAIMCVLMLRGSRTPGELRANSGRLHTFSDNREVTDTLHALINREGGPLVVELPRTPGRKDAEFAHLLCGPVEAASVMSGAIIAPATVPPSPADESAPAGLSGTAHTDLSQRVAKLEAEVAELRDIISATMSKQQI